MRCAIYFAGINLGSAMTKVVVIDADSRICVRIINPTGTEYRHRLGRDNEYPADTPF